MFFAFTQFVWEPVAATDGPALHLPEACQVIFSALVLTLSRCRGLMHHALSMCHTAASRT
jgi:hypothetical protein